MKRILLSVLCLVASLNAAGPAPTPTTQIFFNLNVVNSPVDVKTTAGALFGFNIVLSGGATNGCYVNFFNAPAASVILGTTAPAMSLLIPSATTVFIPGASFSSAISIAITNSPVTGTGQCLPSDGSAPPSKGQVAMFFQ